MHRVQLSIDLEDRVFRSFEGEARRRGVTVESLVEQVVQGLLVELEVEEREGTDHPIITE
jgi:hypothetical protein